MARLPAAADRDIDAMDIPANETGPLTVVVTWRVRKGSEREFEAWRHEIAAAALEFPGHMGVNVILPSGTEREYVVIFRFDTYEHLRAWQESDIRRKLLKKAEPFRDSDPSYRLESGLEYWFSPPGVPAFPPRWKMALVTAVGVWPASILVPWLLNPLIGRLPSVLQALLVAGGIVILLTWVIMPLLVKILKRWL
jgi:antibiotic biosynthesis monooxygenase (ABM) superfamily enzyme